MGVRVYFPYQKELLLTKSPDQVFAYCAAVETCVPKNFPGVERFAQVAPDTYEWTFEKFGYKSYEFQIRLTTLVKQQPGQKVELVSVPKPGQGELQSSWEIHPQNSGTRLRFQARLGLDLPIPGLLKGLAEKVVQSEFTKIFDRYLKNVNRALES